MKNFFSCFILICIAHILPAQCESQNALAQKELAPYITNGQYRISELEAGESETFQSTFYGNIGYKLVVANEEGLGNVVFKILNTSKQVLYDSSKNGDPSSWEIKFKNTSNFIVEISLKDSKKEGCALLLVGFNP